MIPNNTLLQNIQNMHGEQGRAWLSTLPSTVNILCNYWNLENITPVNNMTFNYVAKATVAVSKLPVVLKISFDKESIVREMQALKYFDGAGVIQVIDYYEKHNALLLQQAVPGNTLKSLDQPNVEIIIDNYIGTMKKLHSKPLASNHSFLQLSDWLNAIDKTSPDKIPLNLLNKAILTKNKLLETTNSELVLHGDLHLDNILQNKSQWVAIDPKGVVGDPAFEIFALDFIQPKELNDKSNLNLVLDSRIELIARASNLSAERLKEWLFVRLILSAAWSIEDNCDPSWAINVASQLS